MEVYEILGRYSVVHHIEEDDGIIVAVVSFPEKDFLTRLDEKLRKKNYMVKVERLEENLYRLVIIPLPGEKPGKLWIHVILFLLTILTTMIAGAFQQGLNPFQGLNILKGIPFSFSIMTILLFHEMGHYIMSRKHGVRATLPYFIPFPHPLIGTMGAVIRIKSPIPNRKALLEIGAAGPWAGILVAIPITIIGLAMSSIMPIPQNQPGIYLGDSLLFKFLSSVIVGKIPEGYDLYLHPMAFAGWLGFFVTSLNLLPIGQLDGGHILYALLGKNHEKIAMLTWVFLIIAGIFWWKGWLTWAIITLFLGIRHPQPLNDEIPLDRQGKWLAIASLLLFVLTFIPSPIVVK